MKGFGDQNKFNKKTKKSHKRIKPSKEQILSQAIQYHSQGKISEAAKYYQYFINQGFKDHRVFSNYGGILLNIGKYQEAELYTHKAIEIKPDLSEPYYLLSLIKNSEIKKMWQDQLFSEDILKNKLLYFFFSSKITIN